MKRTPAKKGGAGGEAGAQSGYVEDYDALVHLRGLAKGKVTRLKTTLEREAAELTPPQVKVYQKKLEAAYQEFHNYHERIVAVVAPDAREEQDCKYVEFDTLYDNVSVHLETWLENFATPSPLPTATQPATQQPLVIQQSLPRAIPTFDGRYEQWEKFKVMFKDVVDKSNEPPRIKLYHLEKSLIGDAAGLIDAKTISDGNYDRAWEILSERFEDKRRMVDLHIAGLLNLRKLFKEGHCELRKLLDTCVGHIENLKFLGQEFTGVSELIIVHILTSALDNESKRAWESTMEHGELPNYDDTIAFLKNRISVLERCQTSTVISNQKQSNRMSLKGNPMSVKQSNPRVNAATVSSCCEFCEGDHYAYKCPRFVGVSIDERLKLVREKQVCFNCLRRGHRGVSCLSSKSCSKCQRKHHTLLHGEGSRPSNSESGDTAVVSHQQRSLPVVAATPNEGPSQTNEVTAAYSNAGGKPAQQVLLLTAQVVVLDKLGQPHTCRALLDSGSQINFISESMLDKLGVRKEEANISITGVSNLKSSVRYKAWVQVLSRHSDFQMEMDCLVTRKVTGILPTYEIDVASWNIPPEMQLADPMFYKPGQIDLLIGMEWFDDLMKPGRVKLSETLPTLLDSQFGWLVGGKVAGDVVSGCNVYSHTAISPTDQLNQQMQRFWELESVDAEKCVLSEAEECEAHFQSTFRRTSEGRYVVELPLRETCKLLGDSRPMALRRFYAMESKLCKQPEVKQQYDDFMEEYERLGHCKEVDEKQDVDGILKWYLPHHAVLRPSNSTTKCRVVFDASAKVFGRSLNDEMMIGPTIQPDLQTILLKFRKHRYVLSADIAKMYRQIRVASCHTPLQRIFWRKSPKDPIRVLELQTVTYGTASAPFLAIRALDQLARDEEESHPRAAEVVRKAFYVDNVLFGGDHLEEVKGVQRELISLLKQGGLHLHKWAANDDQLLEDIADEDLERLVNIEGTSANEVIKALGLMWDPNNDELIFLSQPDCATANPTKRQVLSMIAKLFDPLGLLSPVIVLAKVLMQQLWKRKMDWDDQVDEDLAQQWREFLDALPTDGQFRIPRQVLSGDSVAVEIHGFADASNAAYGACIYIRSLHPDGTADMKLVTSKSKVCPITPLTIPRKELMAALLLHRLTTKVVIAMELENVPVVLWSDSQVVLAWINKPLDRLQMFVRNRVAEIKSREGFAWKYVRSADNPADIVSRGMSSKALSTSSLWWNGPTFLRAALYAEETPEVMEEGEIPELKPETIANAVVLDERLPILEKIDSFRKIQRVVAYVLRFASNLKCKPEQRNLSKQLSFTELREATKRIVRVIQREELADEIECIRAGKPCKRIGNLNPYFDSDGILRVGGRIRHSSLPDQAKHQWIVPDKHPVIRALIADIHKENLHAGPSCVVAALRQRYWLLNARSTVRMVIRNCVTCFRSNPRLADQFMGDLPPCRINVAPAFSKVGIDYAGPIFVKQTARKATPVKGYICLFVCMVSKAIHLEAVEDLSTDGFLAALQRFVSRRGVPEEVYSDNGSNFIGAKTALHDIYRLFQSEVTKDKIASYCQTNEIKWTTIPPRAPHFGGLWEAGVKSVKNILKRVYQSANLTIMEFATLLCQIEAILNSRPLYSHSNDPNDPEVLTPGHLIINRPLTAIPEPSYTDIPINRLNRWQYIQQQRQHFWNRWSREYLVELQARAKWTRKKVNVATDTVVLLKEDNVPTQQWKIGKVVRTYPGSDGLVRVVDVRVGESIYRRPIHKLAPLPILDNTPIDDQDDQRSNVLPAAGVCSVRSRQQRTEMTEMTTTSK